MSQDTPVERPIPSTAQLDHRDAYLDNLLSQMTVKELAAQLLLISGNWIVGENSDHEGYSKGPSSFPANQVTLTGYKGRIKHIDPDAGIGAMFDWYPTHPSQFNDLQALNLSTTRVKIPLMTTGECLHTVWSHRQSCFPQSLALSSSFDTDLVNRVGRALGREGRAVGVHVGFAPVLDLAKEPRYGRCQETFGEDYVLVSHLGVAYVRGLSKDGDIGGDDAVAAVPKHLAGHGAPLAGLHSNAWAGRGRRELLSEILTPFKAVIEQGNGAKGVMMAYTAVDEIPAHIDPFLYERLEAWGFDGFVITDWCGLEETVTGHLVCKDPAEAIREWLNLGGSMFLYDFTPEIIVSSIAELVESKEVELATLQKRVRKVLETKYDLGLFHNPYQSEAGDTDAITLSHIPLALEAAQKSIVLLENRNSTLPLQLSEKKIKKLALVGPFTETFNFGTYSGTWGATPTDRASSIRQGLLEHLAKTPDGKSIELVSAWGADTWDYHAQHPIPGYLLSADGSAGGLHATFYHDTDFKKRVYETKEPPNRDWGLYPPIGLESTSFGLVWEGELEVPVSSPVHGCIGVAATPKTVTRLYIDGELVAESGDVGSVMREIMPYSYTVENGSAVPPGGSEFVFKPGTKHHVRIECRVHPNWPRTSNAGVHSRVHLWWNLVDRKDAVEQAAQVAANADLIVLAVGAAWNSDAENGDRATLGLSKGQTKLAQAIFTLGKPVVLVLEGGRPFAIPEFYAQSAAVLSTGFPGQAAGQAIADVLFGKVNPGGRLTMTVPYDAGALPVYYNQRTTKDAAHIPYHLDIPKTALYSFGYGLSYTTFSQELKGARSTRKDRQNGLFGHGDTLAFSVSVTNTGSVTGTYVPQIYLLRRQGSSVTTPNKQLVAFGRVEVLPGQTVAATLELEVDRYLPLFNRRYERVLEPGVYRFALMNDGSLEAPAIGEVALTVEESCKYEKY
ncbi:glycoside hydrolase superfamily [Aspergillus karnatakaensis]|uniref:glycoside hydrolase superfamily n=1 Tax=Aspergillus karnatakaensis TaxID=1810916 RepID=UPI003CCE5354